MKYPRLIWAVFVSVASIVAVVGCSSGPNMVTGNSIHEVLDENVKAAITDPDRRREALAEVKNLADALDAFGVDFHDATSESLALNSDYNATREQFDELRKRHDAQRRGHMQRFMLAALGLRESVTPEEWAGLSESLDSLPGIQPKEDGT